MSLEHHSCTLKRFFGICLLLSGMIGIRDGKERERLGESFLLQRKAQVWHFLYNQFWRKRKKFFNWGKRKRKEFSKIKSLGVNTNLQSLIDIQNLWFSVKFVVELKDFFLAGLEVGVKLLVKVFTRWSGLLASPAPGTSTAASAGWGSTAPVGCTTTEGFVDATASAKKKIIVFK